MEYKYVLKCMYQAHSSDVRIVKPAVVPEGAIITGSRDCLVKVWAPEGKNSFKEAHVFLGATKFISSLCILEPSTQYPHGLILAGSNDCSIYGFTHGSTEPVLRLLGHSDTVCALSAGKFGTIVSGSWDKTARIWSGQQCVLTLSGHQQSVWATELFPTQNLILTGSGDHTIRLWRNSGTCERIFHGHEDCVRGLAILSEIKFLSCSNDCTVRLWKTSGETLGIYRSHADFIYSITLLKDSYDFATCGEDQEIKIWKDGQCAQTLSLPSKSLWSVACLPNGDIAVGGSDGKVYVFEKDYTASFDEGQKTIITYPESETENPNFGRENIPSLVSAKGKTSSECREKELGGLSKPGSYDGETVICYEEESDFMCTYKWNAATGTWMRSQNLNNAAGHTVGSLISGDTLDAHKKEDKGLELNVDVNGTYYKLSYHKEDNPWIIAQNFVAEHNLNVEHIGQVAEFIIKNTENPAPTEIQSNKMTCDYIPVRKYSVYIAANLDGLKKKLLELNELVPRSVQISPLQIDKLMSFAVFPDIVTDEEMALLDSALMWNDEFLFPVLDLLRLAVRSKGMAAKIGNQSFITHLLQIFNSTDHCVNRVLIVKIFCNLFGCEGGENVVLQSQGKIYESVKEAVCISDASIQKAGIALFVNFAVAALNGLPVDLDIYCITLIEVLGLVSEGEAAFRGLLAVGTMCAHDSLAAGYFRSLNIKNVLKNFKKYTDIPKMAEVLNLLMVEFD